ncbi:MAG: phage tail assembly chaperone [Brevundimonas sp.]|nr:MAG: phage tail assembly chaperone [Brevundimonas sp.]
MLRAAADRGMPPSAFWALSLKEWRMLTERPAPPEPMNRDVFQRLAEAWPDD